jgi:hypothetical protein
VWKECILLRLIEPMNLVHEDDRALAVKGEPIASGRDDLAQLGDASENGAERHEVRSGCRRDDLGQGRLAAAGRSPQHHRPDAVGSDGPRQQRVGPKKMELPY